MRRPVRKFRLPERFSVCRRSQSTSCKKHPTPPEGFREAATLRTWRVLGGHIHRTQGNRVIRNRQIHLRSLAKGRRYRSTRRRNTRRLIRRSADCTRLCPLICRLITKQPNLLPPAPGTHRNSPQMMGRGMAPLRTQLHCKPPGVRWARPECCRFAC